ncbi:DUF4112 domain-containing protein [Parenemella sanctibonifatiensis]|nr:DUF4112 domain-containing protein [Parenemella sanctibonifatiensis]
MNKQPDPDEADDRPAPISRGMARLMDDLVTVPGTKFGLGLDALIGLVPGIGDATTTGLASVILIDAVRLRVPVPTLLRMAGNLIIDTGLGLVPAVGDVADAAHRANRKNYRLLEDALSKGHTSNESTTAYLIKAIGVVLITLAIMIAVAVAVIWGLLVLLGRVF